MKMPGSTKMTTDADATDPAAPSRAIEVDLPCRRCGYNVRGLTDLAECPECGAAVALTILGDTLEGADPAWLGGIASGARWVAVSNGLLVAFFVLSGCIGSMTAGVDTVWGLLAASLLAVRLVAVVRWTSADPSGLERKSLVRLRWIARAGAAALLLAVPLLLFGIVAFQAVPIAGKFGHLLLPTLLLAGFVGEVIQLVYGSALMRRSLDRELPARFQTFWGLEVAILVMLAGVVATAIVFDRSLPRQSTACVMLAGSMAYAITVLISMQVYFDCASELGLSITRAVVATQSSTSPVSSSRAS